MNELNLIKEKVNSERSCKLTYNPSFIDIVNQRNRNEGKMVSEAYIIVYRLLLHFNELSIRDVIYFSIIRNIAIMKRNNYAKTVECKALYGDKKPSLIKFKFELSNAEIIGWYGEECNSTIVATLKKLKQYGLIDYKSNGRAGREIWLEKDIGDLISMVEEESNKWISEHKVNEANLVSEVSSSERSEVSSSERSGCCSGEKFEEEIDNEEEELGYDW